MMIDLNAVQVADDDAEMGHVAGVVAVVAVVSAVSGGDVDWDRYPCIHYHNHHLFPQPYLKMITITRYIVKYGTLCKNSLFVYRLETNPCLCAVCKRITAKEEVVVCTWMFISSLSKPLP